MTSGWSVTANLQPLAVVGRENLEILAAVDGSQG
jgi:hypothetical protein